MVPLPPEGKAWFMRKMLHKPVGVDVPGDPIWMNINAASYYIVQTHIPVPLCLPQWGKCGCRNASRIDVTVNSPPRARSAL